LKKFNPVKLFLNSLKCLRRVVVLEDSAVVVARPEPLNAVAAPFP
jgi:hypothetical protein